MSNDRALDLLLENNDLQQYVPVFQEHAIRTDVFSLLTTEDLLELGITSLGHRIKLRKLINAQRTAQQPKTLRQVDSGSLSAASNSPSSIPDSPGDEREDIAALKFRMDNYERQLRKLNDRFSRFSSEWFRTLKEGEPLPTPNGRNASPAVTPAVPKPIQLPNVAPSGSLSNGSSTTNVTGVKSATSQTTVHTLGSQQQQPTRRSPQDGYFSHHRSTAPPSAVSPSTHNGHNTHTNVSVLQQAFHANQSSSLLHGRQKSGYSATHLPPTATASSAHTSNSSAGSNSHLPSQPLRSFSSTQVPTTSGTPVSPSGKYSPSMHTPTVGNLAVSTGADQLQKFHCSEKDNTLNVLATMQRMYNLEGELSQWRLYMTTGGKTRDLLDHERPLAVYKAVQETGEKPVFCARKIPPPVKHPSTGTFI